ncbi:uncharacterized protein LOC143226417 [Tachypleus tridentatus]|uniref:uncharacterized protein LOC143226417 n=1 Tax=Tachypleus tridentatus TaxID=6853 RepID=UPI003FD1635A
MENHNKFPFLYFAINTDDCVHNENFYRLLHQTSKPISLENGQMRESPPCMIYLGYDWLKQRIASMWLTCAVPNNNKVFAIQKVGNLENSLSCILPIQATEIEPWTLGSTIWRTYILVTTNNVRPLRN